MSRHPNKEIAADHLCARAPRRKSKYLAQITVVIFAFEAGRRGRIRIFGARRDAPLSLFVLGIGGPIEPRAGSSQETVVRSTQWLEKPWKHGTDWQVRPSKGRRGNTARGPASSLSGMGWN